MKNLPVATFDTLEPALELQARLAQADVPSVIHDESKLERYWFMSEPAAAFHVEVPPADYLPARELIAAWQRNGPVLKAAVCCPACGSSRIEYPQITRKFLMPILEACLMAVHLLPREYYCLDCQFSWPRTRAPKRDFDLLGFPYDSKFWHPERFAKRPEI